MVRSIASELRRLGWSDDAIATARVDGKPLAEVDKPPPSRRPDGMNKTEFAYATELDWHKRAGTIKAWWFEAVKLRLAKRAWYTPDFLVQYTDGRLVFVEVKGFLRDDAALKFKCAREAYPWAEFVMIRRVKGLWVPVNI